MIHTASPARRCAAGFFRTAPSWPARLPFIILLLSLLLPAHVFGYGGPPSPAGGPNTVPYRSTRTDNRILIMPVQFSGGAANPLSQAAAQTAINEMDTWIRGASFGTFGFSVRTATTVLSLPNTKAYYTGQGMSVLLNEARAAAATANAAWAAANFEFDVVVAESGTFPDAGSANLGAKGMWLPNSAGEPFPKSSFAHELAHNLGLNHAGLWIRPSGSTNPLAAAGTFQDYGSLFDPVGLAGYDRHYSAHYKHLLGWIPAANVATIDSTTAANVRLYAHDGGTMNPARKYAIRIPASVSDAASPGNRDIWLETRTVFNPGIPAGNRDGLIVKWGDQRGSPQGSCDLDLTPNSLTPNNTINDFADAILTVGTLFADPWQAAAGTNRITVTPVASGGTGADKWVDVAITTPNADLSGLTLSAGALSPAFAAGTPAYSVTAIGATTTTVTATAAGAGATIQVRVNGGSYATVTSGTPGSPLALLSGVNTVEVKVTNGGWTKTYTVSVATAAAFPAVAGSLGAIPDGVGSPAEGAPRDVQFTISGMTGTLSNVVVDFTLNPPHSYASDVIVKLIAPNGTTTHTVLSLTHMTATNGRYAGPYVFADDASGLLSTALTAAAGGTAAPGRYRTQSNSNTATSILPAFSAIAGAAINGTWTLRFTDRFSGDTGSVSAANLYLATSTPLSNNADLASLSFSAGSIAPAFGAATTAYSFSVPNATASTTVTAARAEANATLQVQLNGGSFTALTSGTASGALALNVGSNSVVVRVTAQDGTTVKNYTTTITRAAASAVPLPANAVSWYQAENNAQDALGRNPGTASATTYTAGRKGQALNLTGAAGSFVTTTNNASLQLSAGTVEAWIKTAGPGSSYRGIIVKQFAYGLFLENNNLIAYDWVNGGLVSSVNLADNNWHHVALTFTAGAMKLYADGAEVASRAAFGISNQNNALVLGAGDTTGASQNFAGLIDEATIYSRVLSPAEIHAIFTAGAAGKVPSANADLSALATTAGTISPAFAAGTVSYTASVANATTGISVTPTAAYAGASGIQVRINGGAYATVTSGTASGTLTLNVGSNTVNVLVTAEDTTTTKSYTITVTRAAASGGGSSVTVAGTNLGAIPDNNPTGRDILFNVAGAPGVVKTVSTQFTFAAPGHTYQDDLRIELIAPGGTTAWIYEPSEARQNDLLGPYAIADSGTASIQAATSSLGVAATLASGTYRAARGATLVSLNLTFAGTDPNGTWRLRFRDLADGDFGTISQASLTVTTASPGTPAVSLQPNGTSVVTLTQADANSAYFLQGSSNMTTWTTLQTLTTSGTGTANHTDTVLRGSRYYYRIVPAP